MKVDGSTNYVLLRLKEKNQETSIKVLQVDNNHCDDYDMEEEMKIRERIANNIFPQYSDENENVEVVDMGDEEGNLDLVEIIKKDIESLMGIDCSDSKKRANEKKSYDFQLQSNIFQWLKLNYPDVATFTILPQKRSCPKLRSMHLKLGLQEGVADIMFPMPTKRYHGMFIKIKKPKAILTSSEKEFAKKQFDNGYFWCKATTFNEFKEILESYINQEEFESCL